MIPDGRFDYDLANGPPNPRTKRHYISEPVEFLAVDLILSAMPPKQTANPLADFKPKWVPVYDENYIPSRKCGRKLWGNTCDQGHKDHDVHSNGVLRWRDKKSGKDQEIWEEL